MDDLPARWATANLESCVDILDSQRIPVNSDERIKRNGSIPYYGATGQVGWIDDFIFDEELLLIGEDGAPFFDKSKAIAYIIKGKSWVNNHAHVLRALQGVTTNVFLKHYLDQFDYAGYVNGTTRLKLTQSSLKAIPVKIPPSNEQRRIVAKLEKLLAKVDACKERLEKIPAILKRFRQSVLAAACSGRLTADWRERNQFGEDALALLLRIFGDRGVSNTIGRRRGKVYGELAEHLFDVPEGWAWATLTQIGQEGRPVIYGIIKPGPHVPDGVPYVRVTEMKDGIIDVAGLRRASKARAAMFSRATLTPGDLLISKDGTIGRVAIVPPALKGGNITQHLVRVAIHQLINRDYVVAAIRAPFTQDWLIGKKLGVALQGVNVQDFRRLPIPIPPLTEQHEIVHRVEALFKIADDIEKRYQKAKAHVDKLTQSILAKAFRGELVPQDPNDEPASELLKRIQEERRKQQGKGRPVRRGSRRTGNN